MNRLEKVASFGAMMGKKAGLFWKKLDRPVGIKSIWNDPDGSITSMRLDAERTMEPRLLTRLFSSPEKDYARVLSMLQKGEDNDSIYKGPEGRAMLASYGLPVTYPDRYKAEGDSLIGNEDIFEDARTQKKK
jgi:hypothetical protein